MVSTLVLYSVDTLSTIEPDSSLPRKNVVIKVDRYGHAMARQAGHGWNGVMLYLGIGLIILVS